MKSVQRRAVLAAGATLASGLSWRKPLAAEALPPLHFTLADGTERTLADYAGQGVVLNLWATWCVPCVAEMPALDALAGAVARSGVAVLPLSSDRMGAAAVEAFFHKQNIRNLPVLLDPKGAVVRALGAQGIPVTLLIDASGRERGRIEGGADWDAPQTVAMVKALARG